MVEDEVYKTRGEGLYPSLRRSISQELCSLMVLDIL